MCTVSFYKDQHQVIITSNRDEHINRPQALAPRKEVHNNTTLLFPKDPQGGGSWFVVNEKGEAFVLLNGANSRHTHNPPYAKSRGIVLLDLASANHFEEEWRNITLTNIEPFTMVVWQNNELVQVRWNGQNKTWTPLDETTHKIWSSHTLYEPEVIAQREIWFADFIRNHPSGLRAEDLIHFHTQTQPHDQENGIIINRDGKLLTKNVTQFVLEWRQYSLLHMDLQTEEKTTFNVAVR